MATKPNPRKQQPSLGPRILHDLRASSGEIGGVAVIGLLSTPVALLTPVPLKVAIDQVAGGKPVPPSLAFLIPESVSHSASSLLYWCVFLVLAIAVIAQTQQLLNNVASTYLAQHLQTQLRERMFAKAQNLCFRYHDRIGVADSLNKISHDANAIGNFVVFGILPLISASALLTGMFVTIFRLDTTLAIIAILISPPLLLLSRLYGIRARTGWERVRRLDSESLAVIHESLMNLRVVKAFGQESRQEKKFGKVSSQRLKAYTRFSLLEGSFDAINGLLLAAGTACVLGVGISHVRNNALSLGTLVLIMGYLSQLYTPLHTISVSFVSLQSSLAEINRGYSLLDEVSEVGERARPIALKRSKGEIEFDDVSFGYNNNREILSHVSFRLPQGSSLGILGKTGSGKSTIMGLIARFYDPTEGVVRIDGIDLRDISLTTLRQQFAIVLQDPVLFSGTIAENISFGRPGASMSEIINAASEAYVDDFVRLLPDGYDTVVGERGMSLSGGERQRISLARAFLKDAPVLLLDEPTSSVDHASEKVIMQAINKLMARCTTVMVAHRLETLGACDHLLHIKHGEAFPMEQAHLRKLQQP